MRHQEPTKPNTYWFVFTLMVWFAYTIMACYQRDFFAAIPSGGVLILIISYRLMHIDYYKLAEEARLERKKIKSLKQQLNYEKFNHIKDADSILVNGDVNPND